MACCMPGAIRQELCDQHESVGVQWNETQKSCLPALTAFFGCRRTCTRQA